MNGPALPRRLVPLVAVTGLVVAHTLTYWLVIPSARSRARYLAATGHGYFGTAVLAAELAALAAAAVVVTRAARGRSGERSLGFSVPQLAGWQCALFVAAEVAERLASGAGTHSLSATTLAVGLGLQVAAAVVGFTLLRMLERVAVHATRRRRSAIKAASTRGVRHRAASVAKAASCRPPTRAPPSLAIA